MAVWNPPITSSIEYAYETTNVNPTGNTYVDGLLWRGGWTNNGVNSEINASVSDPVNLSYSTLTANGANYVYGYKSVIGEGYGYNYYDWSNAGTSQIANVISNVEAVANVSFTNVGDSNIADINFVLYDNPYSSSAGFADVPDNNLYSVPSENIGVYINLAYSTGVDAAMGSANYKTIQHEFGHAMGLAHPHDEGGGSSIFPGVTSPYDTGDYKQNDGIFTTMGYQDGWVDHPSGSQNIGAEASFMAYDIAALQSKYGANTNYNTGDNTYYLPTSNTVGSTFYECIWDAGGTDTLSNAGQTQGCGISLQAATLDYYLYGGGSVSSVVGVYGGFTIANGVVIENAIGGLGNDFLYGNGAANYLDGGASGDDYIRGYAGNDTMVGGAGIDKFEGGAGNDTIDGGAGDDWIYQSLTDAGLNGTNRSNGNDTIDGGVGSDVLQYDPELLIGFSDLSISKNKDGSFRIMLDETEYTDAGKTDVITNIENIRSWYDTRSVSDLYDAQAAPTINYLLNGASATATLDKYSGMIDYIDMRFIGSPDRQNIQGTEYSEFMNLLGGIDAANGNGGDDILDGGRGSNFLAGGEGQDTFYVDGRGGANTWSTITDFTSADTVRLWGWQDGVSELIVTQENTGASGFEGMTYFYDLDGNGEQETKLTFSGLTASDFYASVNTDAAVPYVTFVAAA